jgi:hypothetical protein
MNRVIECRLGRVLPVFSHRGGFMAVFDSLALDRTIPISGRDTVQWLPLMNPCAIQFGTLQCWRRTEGIIYREELRTWFVSWDPSQAAYSDVT